MANTSGLVSNAVLRYVWKLGSGPCIPGGYEGLCCSLAQKCQNSALLPLFGGLAHPVGVEPDKRANKDKQIRRDAHKNAHTNSAVEDSGLEKVIKAWPLLAPPLKAAGCGVDG